MAISNILEKITLEEMTLVGEKYPTIEEMSIIFENINNTTSSEEIT